MQRVKDEHFNSKAATHRDFIIYPTAEYHLNSTLYTCINIQYHCPLHIEFLSILLFHVFVISNFKNTLKYIIF